MLSFVVAVQVALLHAVDRLRHLRLFRRWTVDGGQTTAEYALVLLGAAALALLVLAWAGKTDRITKLFNGVIDSVLSNVT